MAAGNYGYAHSAINSENFPARHFGGPRPREVALLEFDRDVTATDATTEAARQSLEPPTYEDALYFGIAYPDVQCRGPVVFLHDPWLGFFGRRDVLCLWSNAGRRELGLEGFDDAWSPNYRFAFIAARDRGGRSAAPSPARSSQTGGESRPRDRRADLRA